MKERGLRSSCPFRAHMLGVLTLLRRRRPLVSEFYEGRQFVGMDLHRRRSMLVRMTEFGEHLETVRILNDRDSLAEVMSRAGESPEVVLEATYGWYWAVDALAELGATVHLAHPLGVQAFSYRRVKNDQRDAFDLADLLRMGRLPHAWIAPPATRELRELVRHRAKLVAMRSQCKAHVHAVLAKGGIWVPMTDLFGVEGNLLLDKVTMPAPYKARIASLRRFIEGFDAEIGLFTGLVGRRLTHHAGYTAIQQIPGIGPVLAAVLVAEIGDVHRFAGPVDLLGRADAFSSRIRHHGAPRPDHQTGLAPGAVGGDRIGESPAGHQPHRCHPRTGGSSPRQPQHRRRRRRPKTARARLLRTARPPRAGPAPLTPRGVSTWFPVGADRAGHDPRIRRGRPSD